MMKMHGSLHLTKNRSERLPLGGLLFGMMSLGGVAATALWLSKEVKAKKQSDWTQLEPTNSTEGLTTPVQVHQETSDGIHSEYSAPIRKANQKGRETTGARSNKAGVQKRTNPNGDVQNGRQPEKMISGGEELRDHDFPLPDFNPESIGQTAMEDTGKPEIEATRSGGAEHTRRGDDPEDYEVPTIMDQTLVTPDFQQDGK